MLNILDFIPQELGQFFLVMIFSLIIGLSQRRFHSVNDEKKLFGTDRTFTFIGILGYILYIIGQGQYIYFMAGGAVLSVLLTVYYALKIKEANDFGLTTIFIALITYCLTPLLITQPFWLFLLIVVTVLIFTELKDSFTVFSSRFTKDEFLTLGKFLVMAGVILPIVPDEQIIPFLSITPYKIWLAVVVISSISYFSYLLKKFVFQESGILITGILGGLYSSTSTTVILARKSREAGSDTKHYVAAIIIATAMMYLRILILAAIFNMVLFKILLPWFLLLILLSIALAIFIYIKRKDKKMVQKIISIDKNPLEFKVAIIFTLLFIALSFITYYAINEFGLNGLNILSFLVGFTDIDPFLLTLFQGSGYEVSTMALAGASMQAIISNNIAKAFYGFTLGNKSYRKLLLISFFIITIVNVIALFLI
jgi:uncharacterized membrane protein (DUF4010 family)